MPASKTGSSTIFNAACTIRSRTEGIDNGLCSATPGFGMNTQRAIVATHRHPRAPQDVPAVDLAPQRVEPPSGIGLGRPVERMLQGSDRIQLQGSRRGGTSRNGTHQAPPHNLRIDEAAALPGGRNTAMSRRTTQPPAREAAVEHGVEQLVEHGQLPGVVPEEAHRTVSGSRLFLSRAQGVCGQVRAGRIEAESAAMIACSPVAQPASRTRPRRTPASARSSNAGWGRPMPQGGRVTYKPSGLIVRFR
ncbi:MULTISPECIES: hypothetical protein [unclassified Streptomyces]|uniref:hypothetical protein n=1 Tax=unclassified Streptomyces TaxID=2593676 RepID=UPI00236580B7|nr:MULTISPECIES: hypothetical protein [unclassified Streptomyces]MDF3142082.1 hypothetical protein [Streptomyces sp. T21Q-yed]WDF45005.1 hypothetical protein PBV52_42800 [Streptomyces sp. T12]